MKKNNEKGFLLAEAIVVGVFVLSLFTFLFVNIIPLVGQYEAAESYDTINRAYDANLIRTMILEDSNVSDILKLGTSDYKIYERENLCASGNIEKVNYCNKLLSDDFLNVDKIYVTWYRTEKIKAVAKNNSIDFDRATRDYIDSLDAYDQPAGSTYGKYKRLIIYFNDGTFANIEVKVSETVTSNPSIKKTLVTLIKEHNPNVKTNPTLTKTSKETNEKGLYVSNETTNGQPTYFFRGNVTNNNVNFAGLDWKIIRINEDGTVRLILNGRVNNTDYAFNSAYNNYSYMYYSNSDTAKPTVDSWYQTNIVDAGYDSYVATGTFCEQAKVKYSSSFTSGSATMAAYAEYTPDFKCSTDGNGKGVLNSKVGLITYDEVIHAGGYYGQSNSSYYLYNGSYGIWTMSPAGFSSLSYVWRIHTYGSLNLTLENFKAFSIHPVINLSANVLATGTGTNANPYKIIYN